MFKETKQKPIWKKADLNNRNSFERSSLLPLERVAAWPFHRIPISLAGPICCRCARRVVSCGLLSGYRCQSSATNHSAVQMRTEFKNNILQNPNLEQCEDGFKLDRPVRHKPCYLSIPANKYPRRSALN